MMHYQQSFSFYVSFFFLLFITSVPARNTFLYENPNNNFTTQSDQVTLPRRWVDESHAQKLHIVKHFSYIYINGRQHTWDRSALMLNYAFSPNHTIDYINASEIRAALKRAFSVWSTTINVNFTETDDYQHANITIGFFHGDHGDGSPFEDNLIAHAIIGPGTCMIHFNLALTFAVDLNLEKSDMAFDLETIAVHEIGHVLGLNHSSSPEAVMWPSQYPRTINVKLTLDDVIGAQLLYGSNPDFNLDSVISPDSCKYLAALLLKLLCCMSNPCNLDVKLTLEDVIGAQLLYGSNPDFNLDSVISPASKSYGLGEIIIICVLLVVTALFCYYGFLLY